MARRRWSVGSLASGASATLTRTLSARSRGGHTKTFTLIQSSPADPNAGNDIASVTPVPR
jgi:hypothetical protein